jgi:NAD(P)H-dependent FMN reductase
MASQSKIGIIITSVRQPRVCPSVADFVKEVVESRQSSKNVTYSLIDVRDFNLPVFDESNNPQVIAMYGLSYDHDHTKKWSAEIASYQGFIFVTPEYNYGIPASTKNAIDYLWGEWTQKPAAVVSYGIQGGTNSNKQLVEVFEGALKMKVSPTKITLPFKGGIGPDAQAAMGEGKLGEETKKDWLETKKDDLLKAVEELETNLDVYLKELEEKAKETKET